MPETPETAPVQVLMPAGLLSRVNYWLAMAGMRLYRVPVKDDLVTYLVGVDISAHAEPAGGAWPVADVVKAYGVAVVQLAEVEPMPKSKRKARKNVA